MPLAFFAEQGADPGRPLPRWCQGVYTEIGMQFEWDARKDLANRRKHAAGFREASTVFGDPFATTFPDAEHSADEQRFLTIGLSAMGRLLVVAHTERKETVRIISARPATPRERKFYEEEH